MKLSNGTVLTEMSGVLAPQMWANGETEAVLEYLKGDVVQPLLLAQHIEQTKIIKWLSNSGKPNSIFSPLLTVLECFAMPNPDVSWMSNPPTREKFIEWMPKEVLEKYNLAASVNQKQG